MATADQLFDEAWNRHQAGALTQAEELYRRVLAMNPHHVDAWCFLGAVSEALGKAADAEMGYRRAVQLAPRFVTAHNCLGVLLAKQGRRPAAIASFREALRYAPTEPEIHYNLGLALNEEEAHEAAVEQFREALRYKPEYAEALNDLGNALVKMDQLAEGERVFREALRLRPGFAEANYNLGILFGKQTKPVEEEAQYREALRQRPAYAEAQDSLGGSLRNRGQMSEAMSHFELAMQLKPDYAPARWNRALLLLLLGDLGRGWPEYECRWRQYPHTKRSFPQPHWDGSDFRGKTILLYAEQGLGDTIQFIRYVTLVKSHGGNVIVECQPSLKNLLAGFTGIARLIAKGDAPPAFDLQAPLMSLPGIFRTTLDSIPAAIPYLHANPSLEKHWRDLLAPVNGFRIGIAWRGDPTNAAERQRTIPLAQFGRLLGINGVKLISIQKGSDNGRAGSVIDRSINIIDFGDELDTAAGAFMDTAAIMKNLDLVISSDTAVAHLAGALGVPVWVGLTMVPDWRWMLERQDSPWYPTMRLFRQTRIGDWKEVFDRIIEELRPAVLRTNLS